MLDSPGCAGNSLGHLETRAGFRGEAGGQKGTVTERMNEQTLCSQPRKVACSGQMCKQIAVSEQSGKPKRIPERVDPSWQGHN